VVRLKGLSFILLLLAFAGCVQEHPDPTHATSDYRRIISFAPSITETLFALGLGNRVVGVTRFCYFPLEVKKIPKVGGYLDPNYEMILSLKPDLVLLLQEHSQLADFLTKNKVRFVRIDNENLEGILNSFTIIGRLCGKEAEAGSLIKEIRAETVSDTVRTRRPRMLVCIGRDNPGSGMVAKAFIAGPKTFYSDLICSAGGVNAYTDTVFAYPEFSSEGIMRLAPDIIVDLMAGVSGINCDMVKKDWGKLGTVPAVKNGMVFSPERDYLSIPGPRILLILRDLKNIIATYRGKRDQ
jgi:iron complex transport system substrate-binding protein